jgi:hypothetical protein
MLREWKGRGIMDVADTWRFNVFADIFGQRVPTDQRNYWIGITLRIQRYTPLLSVAKR